MKTRIVTLVLSTLIAASARCHGPTLTPEQIQAAIKEGSKYEAIEKFLDQGLKRKRVALARAMAADGISKYVTFLNDWQAVAAASAAAKQENRELNIAEVHSAGLLHAYVELYARGVIPTRKMDRRYGEKRASLVLLIGQKSIQSSESTLVSRSSRAVAMVPLPAPSRKIILRFDFDVSPGDLQSPVTIVFIDGDGNKLQQKRDLNGALAIP